MKYCSKTHAAHDMESKPPVYGKGIAKNPVKQDSIEKKSRTIATFRLNRTAFYRH
jgi:hypothetical protein